MLVTVVPAAWHVENPSSAAAGVIRDAPMAIMIDVRIICFLLLPFILSTISCVPLVQSN
jgi:hypothetical protein